LIVLVGYVVINGGIQNFLEPRLYGEGLNLNPLVIVLSLILWSFILGPVGALIAVPLTLMVMRLLLENFDETKSIAKMMGSEEK
jgi:predicted PurR-regulated permease PerM